MCGKGYSGNRSQTEQEITDKADMFYEDRVTIQKSLCGTEYKECL